MSHKTGRISHEGSSSKREQSASTNPSDSSTASAGNSKNHASKRWGCPDWWTVIFTEVLALFAIGSFAGLWIQVWDARAAFVKDQRPYVWVTPQNPIVKLGEPIRWDVHYSNYGRSPALNLHSCIQAAYGTAGFAGIRFPSMENPECSQKAFRSQSVVPPGFPAYTTSLGDKPLSEKDVSDIEALDGGALIVGVVQYDDSNGHTYETGFCSYRFRTGAVSDCEKYNYIKEIK